MKALTPRREKMWGVVGVVMAVCLATFDSVRIAQAWRLIGQSAVWATAWGGLAMIATAAVVLWAGRRGALTRGGGVWRIYRWALGLWALVLIVAFAMTHPRHGPDRLTSNLAVGVTTYTAAFFFSLFFYGGIAMLWPRMVRQLRAADSAGSDHQTLTLGTDDLSEPHHQAEVWHVRVGRDEPDYYIAHCACDWVGTSYDKSEPGAEQSARREATYHSANVASAVVDV